MPHLILGYGYCGYYLAKELLSQGESVFAVSRQRKPQWDLPKLNHLTYDLTLPFDWTQENTTVYYLVPPNEEGEEDNLLTCFLHKAQLQAIKIIYFGSSGVYGNHHGRWVTEESSCIVHSSRQKRRLHAETLWQNYCVQQKIPLILLRIGGIFGPDRLPIAAAKMQTALIERNKAPYINHIYVKDLATIAYLLAQTPTLYTVFNIADGRPQRMGHLQQRVAQLCQYEPAPYEDWSSIWEKASPMKREFMQNAKRLDVQRLKHTLGLRFNFTSLHDALLQSLPNVNHGK